ncbi:hypothetical protein [Gluconacetobacter sacchari]|nr:hypothetical protein [Gluconacetobacter sacchari]
MAAFRFSQSCENAQQGRLSRAVRAGQQQRLAGVQAQPDGIENQSFPTENRDILDIQQRIGGREGGRDGDRPRLVNGGRRRRGAGVFPRSCYRGQLVSSPRPGMFYDRWEIKPVVQRNTPPLYAEHVPQLDNPLLTPRRKNQ